MELPLDVIFHISTYMSCTYKSLCAVSRELRLMIRTRSYFAACGPVDIDHIPHHAHIFIQQCTESRQTLLASRKLSREYIYAHADTFNPAEWGELEIYTNLSEDFLDKYFDKLYIWVYVNQPLSESFLRKHMADLTKFNIFRYNRVSESFIRDYIAADYPCDDDWEDIALQCLSEEFITDFESEVGWLRDPYSDMWYHISKYNNLSEEFMHRYASNLCWERISKHQILSESFISAHSGRVHWEIISKHQRLSEEFILANRDRLDWDNILEYQTLSDEFMEEYDEMDTQ